MTDFNILAIGQSGRLQYEAVLLAASLRATNPGFVGKLFIAVPQPGPLWPDDPRITDPDTLALLADLGATILPFQSRMFGASYPYGNKIEALAALPDAPFLFLDTDTLVTGPLSDLDIDFARPAASMRREGTWPTQELYGPGFGAIWKSLYDLFGLDFASSLDLTQPDEHWRRYLYFNAGWFLHQSPQRFGELFARFARTIRDTPPSELVCQTMDPWLDQIALPLVIHALGGGRPGPGLAGLDGDVTCHWRTLPLLYARESDRVVQVLEEITAPKAVKRVLRNYPVFKRMIYQGKGQQVRALFDRAALPRHERVIRNTIKRAGLWER
ncbi:MAG: hypothetical protein V4804_17985 [Pseudomonadota bacterium]